MTEVTFLLGFETDPDADELTYVPGEEILADRSRFADLLATVELGFEPGAVQIGAGGATSRVEDTLKYLVLGLCFRSVPALVRGEEFVYKFFDGGASDLRLVPSGDDAYLSGRHVAALAAPRAELARALHACGTAYLRFLAEVDPGRAVDVQALVAAEVQARAALDGVGAVTDVPGPAGGDVFARAVADLRDLLASGDVDATVVARAEGLLRTLEGVHARTGEEVRRLRAECTLLRLRARDGAAADVDDPPVG